MSADSIAEDMLRAGYERWLRLEEEKDAIGEDLKELFAELKGNGFTPKALRESFRRVRNINDASQQEHDAVVDLYVAALTGARPARTREDDIPHDADGVVIEDEEIGTKAPASKAEGPVTGAEEISSSTEQPTAAAEVTTPDANTHGQTGAADERARSHVPANAEAVAKKVGQSEQEAAVELPVETHTPPAEGNTPTSAGQGDRGAVVPSAAPVVAEPNDYSKPNPWCLDQEECGLSSWDHFCLRCQRVKAERQAVEAIQ